MSDVAPSPDADEVRDVFASRLDEAGVLTRRFIDVKDGEKGTRTPGHQQPENWLEADDDGLSGNYGVHPGHHLIEFDVDDYDDEHDTEKLDALPETFTVESPHTDDEAPGHRYYAVEDDEAVRDVLNAIAGTLNPEPSWGEVKYDGKYVVGPGSQLDGCTKKWCDECDETDGGYYRIAEDKPIATITADDIREVLLADPEFSPRGDGDTKASDVFGLGGDDRGETSDYDGDGWTEDEARKALSYISPSLSNDKWVRIGYALGSEFGDEIAEKLYVEWSKGGLSEEHSGTKWNDDAERRAPDIIERAESKDSASGNVATMGTVYRFAVDNGWDAPGFGRDGNKVAGDEVGMTWEHVRGQYAEEGKQAGRYYAAQALEDRTAWMHILEEERLWVYDESSGTFGPWGKQEAAKMLERGLGEFYSRSEKGEVIDRLMSRNQTRREEINGGSTPSPLVCVGNGVVNLETGEKRPHSPEHKFTRGLTWDYKPETADTGPILEFLDDITTREADRDTILDHLAHGLMPGHPYRAFIMMYGPGANGKTQLGQLLRGFVGSENAASVELPDLTGGDDFATGALPGKFINVGDDVSVSEIRDASVLKSLTGGGTVRANEKNEKQFDFENEAAMFFSANEPPRITEDKDAIADRLYPIEMPYQFKGEEEYNPEDPHHKRKVPGIADDLLENEAAMKGLLVLCVEHAQRLIETDGQYSMPEGPSARRLRYEAASDPIARFAFRCFEDGDASDAVIKDDAYTVYKRLCEADDERTTDGDTFKRMITQLGGIDVESSRVRGLTPGDSRDRVWKYVRFSEDATEYMTDRLRGRYFPEGEWGSFEDEQRADEDPDEQSVFGAVPVKNAAETLTGYVTVTVEIATTTRLDNGPLKAIAKDESGAIDIVAWDAPFDTQLEDAEGEAVAIENAEVTEYEGTRQLTPVEGLTEISHIQQGVGYTPGEPTGEGQATLNGDDGRGEIEGMRGRVLAQLREEPKEIASVASLAGSLNESPPEVEDCLENLAMSGTVARFDGGYSLD